MSPSYSPLLLSIPSNSFLFLPTPPYSSLLLPIPPDSSWRWIGRLRSAFPDVDAAFGSLGSFFRFAPLEGSFEANPPFVPEVMHAAVKRAETLLFTAEQQRRALSFVFVVPTWEPLPFWQQLCKSSWRRGEALHLAAESHAFLDGAQHTKAQADRMRPSSFGSTLVVLQTAAGAARWAVDAQLGADLTKLFEAALPTQSDAHARMQRGGGDAVAQLLARRAEAAEEQAEGATEEAVGLRAEAGGALAASARDDSAPAAAPARKKKRKRPEDEGGGSANK